MEDGTHSGYVQAFDNHIAIGEEAQVGLEALDQIRVESGSEAAMNRARTIAAPMNCQRFDLDNPCSVTGSCGNCKNVTCICNQILVTRNCRPKGRIKFIIVGEDLGF